MDGNHTAPRTATLPSASSIALSLLLDTLSLTDNRVNCSWTVLGCVLAIRGTPKSLWQSRFTVHLISYLTWPRQRHEMEGLIRSINCLACTCAQPYRKSSAQELHDSGGHCIAHDRPEPIFNILMQPVLSGLMDMRANVSVQYPELYRRSSRTLQSSLAWPESVTLADLLPHGRENTVRGSAAWFSIRPSIELRAVLFALLEAFMRQCPGETTPIIVNSQCFVYGLSNTIEGIHLLVDAAPTMQRPDDEYHIAANILHMLARALSFLFEDMFPEERYKILGPSAARLLKAAFTASDDSRTLQRCLAGSKVSLALKEDEGVFLSLGVWLTASVPEAISASGLSPSTIQWAQSRTPRVIKSESDPWKCFIRQMTKTWLLQRCGSPNCMQTFADNTRGPRGFKVCAECKRVYFCSTTCLRAAMAHPLSHGKVCPLIRELCCKLRVGRKTAHERRDHPPQHALYLDMAEAVARHGSAVRLYEIGGEWIHELGDLLKRLTRVSFSQRILLRMIGILSRHARRSPSGLPLRMLVGSLSSFS
jgi:hypothetical protein